MSMVTCIILHHGGCEDWTEQEDGEDVFPIHTEINAYFEGREGLRYLAGSGPNCVTGGDKGFQADVLVGAFNYLGLNRFLAHLAALEWKEPSNVQVFYKEDEDEKFSLVEPCAPGVRELDEDEWDEWLERRSKEAREVVT